MLGLICSLIFGKIFDMNFLLKKIKKFFLYKNIKNTERLQIEANKLFTGSDVELEISIIKIFRLFNFGCFFMPILPWISILMFFSFLIFFFMEKWLFARRYALPEELGPNLPIFLIFRLGLGSFYLLVTFLH